MSLFAIIPTHPAGAALPAGTGGAAASASSASSATGSRSAGAARAAQPFTGKTKLVPFVVGCVLALALADTKAAPLVIAILTGAVIFQVMNL